MKKKVMPLDFLIYLFFLTAITCNIVDVTFKFMDINYSLQAILLITLGSLTYFWVSTNFRYAFISILVPIILLGPGKILNQTTNFIESFPGFINNLLYSQYLEEEYIQIYFYMVYIVLIIALMAIYYFVVLRKNASILLIAGTTIYVIYYFLGAEKIFESCSTYLVLNIILYAFNEYMKRKNKWSVEDIDVRRNYFFRWISLTVILVVLTSFLTQTFKYDFKPASFDWFEDNVISKLEDLTGYSLGGSNSRANSRFTLAQTGFQTNPNRLGGPIVMDNSIAFRLLALNEVSNLHLRGSVQDYYDGKMWSKSNRDSQKYTDNIDEQVPSMDFLTKSIVIKPENTITSTAFNPLYPLLIKNRWGHYYVSTDLEILNPKKVKKGKSYEVQFKDFELKALQNYIKSYFLNSEDTNEQYTDGIERYLQISETVPNRVRDLSREITSGYNTPMERASAIEKYLKTNFRYETNTSIVPEGRDFVDYFIFDEKKGYCTYFATAMAVMCRIEGIPARYVEGYAINDTISSDEEINVLNSEAHAWVELYFNNIGWVTFDPTPGMTSLATDYFKVDTQGEEAPSEEPVPGVVRPTPQRPDIPREEVEEPSEVPNKEEKPAEFNTVYIILPVMGILLISLMILLMKLILFKKRNYLFYSIQKLIIYGAGANVKYTEGETVREFAAKLSRKLTIDLSEYVEIFEGNIYGKERLKEEDIVKIRRLLNRIRNKTGEENAKLKFYVFNMYNTLLIPFKRRIRS